MIDYYNKKYKSHGVIKKGSIVSTWEKGTAVVFMHVGFIFLEFFPVLFVLFSYRFVPLSI
jgi:hypothetical protein